MKRLEAVNEGDGTVPDNTCVVHLSDGAEFHHSRGREWPMVLVGNLGGSVKAGRYVEYAYYGKKGHKTIGSLYAALLHAAVRIRSPRPFPQLPTSNLARA